MTTKKEDAQIEEVKKPTCGIIMPISQIENCGPEHWLEVYGILKSVCESFGFTANIVSNAEESNVIQKRIVENIYSSDIVICDVSCKNSNVMFELGMRLAFDKPTVIIKDELTEYSFDTSIIEHLAYPRDLRFNKIIDFKEKLGRKLKATYDKSKEPGYSTFLKNFGEYKIVELEQKEVSTDVYILQVLEELRKEINNLKNTNENALVSRKNKFYGGGESDREDYSRQIVRNYLNSKNINLRELTDEERVDVYHSIVSEIGKSTLAAPDEQMVSIWRYLSNTA